MFRLSCCHRCFSRLWMVNNLILVLLFVICFGMREVMLVDDTMNVSMSPMLVIRFFTCPFVSFWLDWFYCLFILRILMRVMRQSCWRASWLIMWPWNVGVPSRRVAVIVMLSKVRAIWFRSETAWRLKEHI